MRRADPGSRHLLRRYVLTRMALAIPTVLILLTMVFLLMRVAPGRPDPGGARRPALAGGARAAQGTRPASTSRSSSSTSSTSATSFTLDLGTTLTDNRTVTSIIVENGSATVELTFCGVHDHAGRRDPGRAASRAIPRRPIDFGGPDVRDHHLRDPGVLPRLPGPDLVAPALGLPTSGRASPIVDFELSKDTHFYLIDTLIPATGRAFWDVRRAPDPAGGHARA